MKKFEEDKAKILEVLTNLADAISSAEIADDTQLALFLFAPFSAHSVTQEGVFCLENGL